MLKAELSGLEGGLGEGLGALSALAASVHTDAAEKYKQDGNGNGNGNGNGKQQIKSSRNENITTSNADADADADESKLLSILLSSTRVIRL